MALWLLTVQSDVQHRGSIQKSYITEDFKNKCVDLVTFINVTEIIHLSNSEGVNCNDTAVT